MLLRSWKTRGVLEGLSPLLAPGPVVPFVVCALAEEDELIDLLDLQSFSLGGDLESYIPRLTFLALVRHRIFLLMRREMLLQLEPKALLIHVHYLSLAL